MLWITLLLFLVSSIIMAFLNDTAEPLSQTENRKKPLKVIKEGWKLIWDNPIIKRLHVLIIFEAIASVVWIAAILYVYVSEVLQKSESWWGYINTTFFFGLLVGGFIVSKLVHLVETHMRSLLIGSSFCVGLLTLFFGLNSIAILALVLSVLVGVVEQVKSITMNTYIQKEADAIDLPKIYGLQGALFSFLFGFSSLLFGCITEFTNVQLSFILAGTLLTASAIYLLFNRKAFPKTY
ncbi:hypothetical protein LC087_14930 [Bacillus carboniphilus]|uniref:MFS transporter n=1 Tax=Bacillus carboniphilus TaxID=86663 RepID=A0ABY9JRL6_9BACI|nr:MFS transporter [Bacillus carboniphilus]WLR42052.1 hypothetical protein LC087_14930 [Bacillus carboniphilus]